MSALLLAENLSHQTPDGRSLFTDLSLSFGTERTGLIGRNGVGKTTLLKLLLGELQPQSGIVRRQGRLGMLRQEVLDRADATAADQLGIADGLAVLDRIAAGNASEDDLAAADWTLESRMEEALNTTGLNGLDPNQPISALSGGEVTRLSLAALLLDAPDMLVLDEPTNNLDTEARHLVAQILGRWQGGALVVSHDRALLRGMDRIVELSSLGARIYGGNWDVYKARKDHERDVAGRELINAERAAKQLDRSLQQAKERKQKRDASGKRGRASRSHGKTLYDSRKERSESSHGRQRIVTDRLRKEAAETLAEKRQAVERLRNLRIALPSAELPAGKTVLAFDQVAWSTPDGRPVLSGLSFTLTGPERVAVTGRNGAGKTTLIRLAIGDLEPDTGSIRRLEGRFAMLDQKAALLDPHETIAQNFRRLHPAVGENTCRAVLARFLFRAEAAEPPVGQLSGGETLRAALTCTLGGPTPPRLLILDEPTNHLDLESIAAIEAALIDYDGALLVVSHDRDFLEAIGIERVVEL
ncbi:MAG: ABC-F family ATP-binding cassette domain-containing protein [Pseudomonadota bacterium]